MSTPAQNALPRSPEAMRSDDTGLLVIDMQERMLAVQPNQSRLLWNIRRLLDGANLLGVTAVATEQVPEKLGSTVPLLAERLATPAQSKAAFSCGENGELFTTWQQTGITRALVCGIETHVCVQQTVLDLLAFGFQVLVVADAVGARFGVDHQIALRRMEVSGALLATTESALFEWCGRADRAEFRQISELMKETQPPEN